MANKDDVLISIEPKLKDESISIDESSIPLEQLILRITQEKGSFANLSEESLLQEIGILQKQRDCNSNEITRGSGSNRIEEVPENSENTCASQFMDDDSFEKSRQKLRFLIEVAQGESALSQDFVSLLMSGLKPASGTTSMSPYLKANVPTGSLNADSSQPISNEDDPFVSAGWKLVSLENAASDLKTAAQRLDLETSKEVSYWKSVLSIASNGEVLFKLRKGDTRDLSIKYGFADSGSQYQDKGIAVLRRRNDGTLSFQTDVSKRTKVVRATFYQVLNGDRIKVGVSSARCGVGLLPEENNGVETEIQNARNLLFEEELFHQMILEARGLASHRVQVIDHKIVINLYDEILELEYVEPESNFDVQYSTRANFICAVFRILLCNLHRRNLQRRRQFPSSIVTNDVSKKSAVYILQPLLAHVLHEKILKRTRKALELLVQSSLGGMETEGPVMVEQESVEPSDSSASSNLNSTSYLGRLAIQPASNITISAPGKFIMIVSISSPLQWSAPLYNAAAYKWVSSVPGNRLTPFSSNGFHDLSDLSEWATWVVDAK